MKAVKFVFQLKWAFAIKTAETDSNREHNLKKTVEYNYTSKNKKTKMGEFYDGSTYPLKLF